MTANEDEQQADRNQSRYECRDEADADRDRIVGGERVITLEQIEGGCGDHRRDREQEAEIHDRAAVDLQEHAADDRGGRA